MARHPNSVLPHLYAANCGLFAADYLSGPREAPYNGRFAVGPHHIDWADLVNQYQNLCILAARGHGKSYFFTFAYPIWQMMRHRGKKFGYIFSGSQPQAEKLLSMIKAEIETNPKLMFLKPTSKKQWAADVIELTTGMTVYARGYATKVRGGHPVWAVCDDVLNDEDAYSETIRQKNIDYFYSAVFNMMEPNGQIIVVGTPFSAYDLYGDLANNKQFHFVKFPAIRDPNTSAERALWPDRFSLEKLQLIRETTGELRFAREQMCEPVSSGSSLFPHELFIGHDVEQFTIKLGQQKAWWTQRMSFKSIYMGVDFALSANAGDDYHVIVVIGVDKFGNRWLLDMDRQHRLSYQAQLSNVVKYGNWWRPDLIYVEAVQAQRIWGEELIRLTDLPIQLFFTTGQKHSLEDGVPALRLLFDNRKLRLPRGDGRSIELTDIMKEEFKAMAMVDGKVVSTARHDDCVMAFYICNAAIESSHFAFSFHEEEGDAEALALEMARAEEADEVSPGEFVGYAESVYDRIRRSCLVDKADEAALAKADEYARHEARRLASLPPPWMRAPTSDEVFTAGPRMQSQNWFETLADAAGKTYKG